MTTVYNIIMDESYMRRPMGINRIDLWQPWKDLRQKHKGSRYKIKYLKFACDHC